MNIVTTITKAMTDMFAGVGTGLVSLFDTVFKSTAEGGGLTTVAIVGLTMLGIGLALGFIRMIFARILRV